MNNTNLIKTTRLLTYIKKKTQRKFNEGEKKFN